jgi:hypothetical protein
MRVASTEPGYRDCASVLKSKRPGEVERGCCCVAHPAPNYQPAVISTGLWSSDGSHEGS